MAFDKKISVEQKTTNEPSFGFPPDSCLCGEPAKVSILTVMNENTGELITGAASELCFYGKGGVMELKTKYAYEKWNSYCPSCWSGIKPPGERTYSDSEVRTAWLWFMGKISSGSENIGGIFKEKHATLEQEDYYLLLVNREAKRTGTPDAIPEEYKLKEVWA